MGKTRQPSVEKEQGKGKYADQAIFSQDPKITFFVEADLCQEETGWDLNPDSYSSIKVRMNDPELFTALISPQQGHCSSSLNENLLLTVVPNLLPN